VGVQLLTIQRGHICCSSTR